MAFIAPLLGTAIGAVANAVQSKPQQTPLVNPLNNSTVQADNSSQTGAITNQAGLASQLAGNNGVGNQNSVYGQQQALANQLGQMAQGNGPNPALAQLQQTTGQNVANQAALAAGQRGSGANAGLLARQIGQNSAQTQQQAVGQAATLDQQQQLNAINALQAQQQALGNTAQNQIGNQQSANTSQAGLAAQQQGLTTQAIQQQNAQNIAQQQGVNQIGAQQGAQTSNQVTQIGGGIASGLGTALGVGQTPASNTGTAATNVPVQAHAQGGIVRAYANGGPVFANSSNQSANLKEGYKGKSKIGKHLMMAKGGKVPALVSPGEIYLPPEKAEKVKAGKASPLSGEKIKGKPVVGGAINSYANDTVKKDLKPGGIILPRAVTQSKKPSESALKFIETLKKKHGVK